MAFLAALQLFAALGFVSFGFQIAVHSEYNLIKKYREGRATEAYMKRLGVIDLSFGILNLISGVMIVCFHPACSAALFLATAGSMILALVINEASVRRSNKK